MHDPDDLVHLGLLLAHLPGSLDLPHLFRARNRFPVGAQRPLGGGFGGPGAGVCHADAIIDGEMNLYSFLLIMKLEL